MKKTISYLMMLVATFVFVGVASAHCGKCGMDGDHANADKKDCAMSADKKECDKSADKKQCSMKKGEKSCAAHCSKPCCSTAKTNFGPRKR